jgi:hypothetical protein
MLPRERRPVEVGRRQDVDGGRLAANGDQGATD